MQANQLFKRSMLVLTFMIAALSMPSVARAQAPDDIIGIWETEDGGLKFEMFNAGSQYQARLLYGQHVMEPDNVTFRKDTKNPDEALRSRSLKHITILSGLTFQNGEWVGGSLYSPRDGTTYSCNAKVVDGQLHMRGFVGISLLGRTIVFRRVPS